MAKRFITVFAFVLDEDVRRRTGAPLPVPLQYHVERLAVQTSATAFPYTKLDDMYNEAKEITDQNLGKWFKSNTVAFFCVMPPHSAYVRCGPISEDYGVGFFRDDDYCRRVQAAGLVVACAEDVFVHHHLSASFNKQGEERKCVLFETNRAIYEAERGLGYFAGIGSASRPKSAHRTRLATTMALH
ncbi:MAG: hypothetical protein LBV45_01470 [Xanthomonadaceae bacterium]|nr:hypothetical protein [Xanthomonadaceae bacterium]